MRSYDELVNELAELSGILPEYWDIFGNRHMTSADTKKAILRAMKFKTESADDVIQEINEIKSRPWQTFIEPVHIISVNKQPFSIPVYIPAKEGDEEKLIVSYSIEDERGRKEQFGTCGDRIHISERKWIEGMRYVKANLVDTKRRDIGYYTLHVTCKHHDRISTGRAGISKTSKVIITPDACFMPEVLYNGRAWGLSVNLYSIRSKRNWGIGDFRDLAKIVKWTAELKGHFVGINPLHAIPNTKPFGISPYSPVSRIYKNFVYLDVENIPEIREYEGCKKVRSSKNFSRQLRELRKTEFIDYEKVALLKEKMLRKAFAFFYKKHFLKKTSRGRAFGKYMESEGLCLESFALFMSLHEYMRKKKNAFSWQEWPEAYHKISGRAVRKFSKENRREILFYQYVQWLIDGQLKKVAEKAKKFGMKVGLYHDLAVGSMGGGSDAWSFRDVIAIGADAGAPPDDFSPDGQKWGFPPIIPGRLKESGYELFIYTIRKNMKHFGALRIDHALGMFRLFWVPKGMTPNDGAYVSYPSEDLLRIIALESIRNRTMVIAEDLGTIGENVRETLKRLGAFSYRLFYFERNYPDPSFLSPEGYPLMALCAVTTHDLPTIYGYWKGRDIEKRRAIGKYPDDSLWNKQIEERKRDKALILSALKSRGIIPDDYPSDPAATPEMTPELCRAIYHYLALTPCKLLLVSPEDILGALDQQNMPGTVDSHPNWVQKMPIVLEKIIKDSRFIDLSKMLNKYFN
jgi:4-alpha-glucanotransferase